MNKIILGDNLSVMRGMEAETIDLCYIDPPFFTKRDLKSYGYSFNDKWDSFDFFLNFIEERCKEIHRLLKPTGSFYLHCDHRSSHYIKIILDKIFNKDNFRNEIVWKRNVGFSSSKSTSFYKNYDSILLYSKNRNYIYNEQFYSYKENTLKMYKDDNDNKGLYCTVALRCKSKKNIEFLRSKNEIVISRNGKERFKVYLKDNQGPKMDNFWNDIKGMGHVSKLQRTGYPTQKPELLLERIIKASSNEGDFVLDCFMGSGTTVAVAKRLGRNYIGIDSNPDAIKITEERLSKI